MSLSLSSQYFTIFLVFAVLIIFMLFASKKIKSFNHEKVETRFQMLVEIMFEYFENIVESMLGKKRVRGFTPLAMTIFMSILITNAASIFLLTEGAFLNPVYTFTWSISMMFFWSFYAIYKGGILSFLRKGFVGEIALMAPLETLSFFVKPLSLGVRLMGNITAGAIIMVLVYQAPQMIGSATNVAIGSTVGVVSIFTGAALSAYFSLFGPFIQATVFTYITLANIAGLLPEEE